MNMTATKTYSNRSNCIAGARTAMGNAKAKIGTDFEVYAAGERFAFRVLKDAARATAIAMAGKPGPKLLDEALNLGLLGPLPAPSDDLTIPGFLKRGTETAEAAAERRARQAKDKGGADRVITMPKTAHGGKAKGANAGLDRKDGLRSGSKMAMMIDMVLAPGGATEAEVCKKLGWKACLVTLKRTAEKGGYDLTFKVEETKDGSKRRYFASPKKGR
jgi:hypothetical protein